MRTYTIEVLCARCRALHDTLTFLLGSSKVFAESSLIAVADFVGTSHKTYEKGRLFNKGPDLN
jgi:hypothetical protein